MMIHRFAEHYQAVFVESKANSTTLAGGELFSQSPTIFITATRPDELSSVVPCPLGTALLAQPTLTPSKFV